MIRVDTHEAKTTLSALLSRVEESGGQVITCRNGKPIAELRCLVPVADPFRPHPVLSKVVFHEDPSAPLDPEDWPDGELL